MNHLGQMIPINFIIQILGLGGLVIAAYAFQSNNYKHIIMFKLCSEFLFALQYFLLGAYTGMAMDLLSSVRNLIYKRKADQNQSACRYIFIFLWLSLPVLRPGAPFTVSFLLSAKYSVPLHMVLRIPGKSGY